MARRRRNPWIRGRFHELNRLGYDPFAHLQLDSGGLWAFTDAGSRAVAEWTRAYFRERQEDTRAAAVPMVTGFGFSLSRPGAPGFDDELDEALEAPHPGCQASMS